MDALLEALGLERRAPDARFFEDLFLRFQRRVATETLTRPAGDAAAFDPAAFFENWIEEERGLVGEERALAFAWLAGQLGFACEVENSICFRPWETSDRAHRTVVTTIGGRRILADAGFPMPVLLPLDGKDRDREFPTGFGTLTVADEGGRAAVLCDARGEVAELLRLAPARIPSVLPLEEISRASRDTAPKHETHGSYALRVLDDRVLYWRAGRMTILDAWSRLEYPLPPSARAALEKLFALELDGIGLPEAEPDGAHRPATLSVFHLSPVPADEARRLVGRDALPLTLVTAREARVEDAADGGSRITIAATLADVPPEGPGEAVRKTLVFHLVSEIFALAEGGANAP